MSEVEVADNAGFNPLSIVLVLAKRKMLILSICSISALLSLGYSLTLPNIYLATTKVLPPQKESSGLSSALGQMGGLAGLAGAAKQGAESELYISILKSRSVGDEVIQRLQLGKVYGTKTPNQTWRKLEQTIKAQAGRDGIITISAEDKDPKLAALLANTMADELGRTLVRLNLSKVGSEKLFLEKRLDVVRKALQAAEEDLKDFGQRHKLVQVEAQSNASVLAITRLKSEIASKEVQLAVLRNSQTNENFEAKALQAAIDRLKGQLARAAGNGYSGQGVPSIGDVPGLGLEYARKMRELKVQESVYEQLTKQYEMAKFNQAKDGSTLQILDEAVVPEEKIRPRRSTILLFSAVIALVSSAALALALEYLERMPESERKLMHSVKTQLLTFRTAGGSSTRS